ncbi:MAG: hypothetical protein IT292_10690 [Deltaproteobacteria bacterium]|nr:hypothetical protein [Deltaproteobacteria bacterium]
MLTWGFTSSASGSATPSKANLIYNSYYATGIDVMVTNSTDQTVNVRVVCCPGPVTN